jgi:hypothetical protein
MYPEFYSGLFKFKPCGLLLRNISYSDGKELYECLLKVDEILFTDKTVCIKCHLDTAVFH